MALAKSIPTPIKEELIALLKRIPNPKKVRLKPNLSNPEYKYYLQPDGTYRMDRKVYLSDGQYNE